MIKKGRHLKMANINSQLDYKYKIYLKSCENLAKSIVIKSNGIAEAMNLELERLGIAYDKNDKSTWRYYYNICGKYHERDTMMSVISVDTLERIDFTPENLEVHTATKASYAFGSRLYNELVSQYPDQLLLINGILFPTDMDTALNAENGTILAYPDTLVEPQEFNLINDIQKWINGYLLRIDGPTYNLTDELYTPLMLGIMYIQLLPAIINIRKEKCKTSEAHSFHIKRFLSSHGFLDEYFNVMTQEQMVRFYININWIERNFGMKRTQEWLTNVVLTKRNIPLSEYNFAQDKSDQPIDIYAKTLFRKKSINNLEYIDNTDTINLNQLLTKEDELAPGNPEAHSYDLPVISQTFKDSLDNKLKTKVLESKMIDYTDSDVIKLSDTLLNLWIDYSTSGIWKSYVYIDDPVSGNHLQMSEKDALILYIYCVCKGYGYDIEYIPDVQASMVLRNKKLFTSDLSLMQETNITHASDDAKARYHKVPDTWMNAILSTQIQRPTNIVSIPTFYNHALEVYNTQLKQYNFAKAEPSMTLRGYKTGMFYRMYCDKIVQLHEPINGKSYKYSNWLITMLLDFTGYGEDDFLTLAKAIQSAALGLNLNSTLSVRSIQRAMCNLFMQLSSYSVQMVRLINDSNLLKVIPGWSSLDYPDSYGHGGKFVPREAPWVLGTDEYEKSYLVVDDTNKSCNSSYKGDDAKQSLEIDPNLGLWSKTKSIDYHWIRGGNYATIEVTNFDNPDGLVPVNGMETYASLSQAERRRVKDVYGTNVSFMTRDEEYPDNP